MISFLLVVVAGIWFWWMFRGEEMRDDGRQTEQLRERIAERQAIVERIPDSAGAHEALGDVLREADEYEAAIACYEQAQAIISADPARMFDGTGLEGKLRLTRMDLSEQDNEGHGQSISTRQQVCRQCGNLNAADDKYCQSCGGPLLVDTMQGVWQHEGLRKLLKSEALHLLGMLAIVTVAIGIFEGMSLEIKGVLLIATVIVLGWKFLQKVGPH